MFSFTYDENNSLTLESAVFQALGVASVAWSEVPHGFFDSERCKEIGDALLDFIVSLDDDLINAEHELMKSIRIKVLKNIDTTLDDGNRIDPDLLGVYARLVNLGV